MPAYAAFRKLRKDEDLIHHLTFLGIETGIMTITDRSCSTIAPRSSCELESAVKLLARTTRPSVKNEVGLTGDENIPPARSFKTVMTASGRKSSILRMTRWDEYLFSRWNGITQSHLKQQLRRCGDHLTEWTTLHLVPRISASIIAKDRGGSAPKGHRRPHKFFIHTISSTINQRAPRVTIPASTSYHGPNRRVTINPEAQARIISRNTTPESYNRRHGSSGRNGGLEESHMRHTPRIAHLICLERILQPLPPLPFLLLLTLSPPPLSSTL